MTTLTAKLYDSFAAAFGNDLVDLATDQMFVALATSSYVPNYAADTYWSTPQAFEPSGAGYTAGGHQLSGTSWSGTDYTCADPSWNSLTLSNVRYLVFYDKTSGTGPSSYRLVMCIDLGAPQNLSGQPLSVTLPGGRLFTLLSQGLLTGVSAASISDATVLGRELLTAADAPTARSELGAVAFLGPAASQTAMLTTLQGNVGDFCYRTDANSIYFLTATPASSASNWSPPARSWPFPMARNTIAAIGDSFTAIGGEGWYQPWLNPSYLNQLCVRSHQRIRYGAGNFSVSGSLLAAQYSSQFPKILAMNPLPGACVLAIGPGEVTNNTTYSFSNNVATLRAMIAALVAVGVVPILFVVPPIQYPTGGNSVAQIQVYLHQWNAFIRREAAMHGYPLIDGYTAMANVDGTQITGTTTDLLHPSPYGHRLIAEQALADGLADWFPPNSLVNTARTTDDLTNMFGSGTLNWGLFTTDTNSDGVANGLSKGTDGTAALVAPAANEQLMGNWQQLTVPATKTGNLTAVFSTGWSIGDTIAFSYRLKTANIEANLGWHMAALKTDTPGGYVPPDGSASQTWLWNGSVQWQCDFNDGELYTEFVIPSAATDLQLWISLYGGAAGGGCTLSVGEITVRNLTTGGLLI